MTPIPKKVTFLKNHIHQENKYVFLNKIVFMYKEIIKND